MPDSPIAGERPAKPDPICAACSQPLASGTLVVFEDRELFHVRCVRRALDLGVMKAGIGSRPAKNRAVENMKRAARLVGASEHLRTHAYRLRRHTVVIVQRGRPNLHLELEKRFGEDATLMEDRRLPKERRQKAQPVAVDRRQGRDRRRPLMEPEEQLWREAGYRIVYPARDE